MACPFCGTPARPNSKFCPGCGKPLPGHNLVVVNNPQRQWEYLEITFPRNAAPGEDLQTLAQKSGDKVYAVLRDAYSIANALNDFWLSLEQPIRRDLQTEIDDGWEPDPTGWGPSCIEYRLRSVGMSYWSASQWVWYGIVGLATYGVGLLVMPFLSRAQIVEPLRVNVRLRRWQ